MKTAARSTVPSKGQIAAKTPNAASRQPAVSPVVGQISHLHETIGNRAVQKLFKAGKLQAALKIGQPSDKYEQEADRVADRVMRMPEPGVQRTCTQCASSSAPCPDCSEKAKLKIQRKPSSSIPEGSTVSGNIVSGLGAGEPLDRTARNYFESRFGADFSRVRVHTGPKAAESARSINARAFTVGRDVVFGAGEYRPQTNKGKQLLAHELTHTIQQGASLRRTEDMAGDRSGQLSVATSTGSAMIQRQEQNDSWLNRAGRAIGGAVSGVVEFSESIGWRLLEEFAPELVPIVRQGPLEWFKEKITSAVESVFNTLMAPVRAVIGVASSLSGHFSNLVAWIRHAAARIAQGDCGAITEAAEKIQQVFEGLAAPVIDRIKHLMERAKGFFNGLWDRFGAPVWQFLQRIGGQAWEKIQQLGRWIWEKTAPIRRVLNKAWTWIKNKLGIGEGPEGQDGLLQWVQRKAQSVWDEHVKPFYERYRRPILVVVGVLVMLSPAGPVIAIGSAIAGLAAGIRWIRQHFRSRDGVVQQRDVLRRTVIPGIMSAVNQVSGFLVNKARFIADKLTQVVSGLNEALGAVAGSILSFAVGILQWVVNRFQELVDWAVQGLMGLADSVANALDRLRIFLQPVLSVLGDIARVIGNMMQLPMLLAGRLWNAIPACIRNPFINFFIPLILRQIAFFRELAATPEAWQQTRTEVMGLIHKVFRDFDLIGAMRSAFRLVVRALRIPVDLMSQLLDKAASAWDAVIAAPLRFIENALKAILQGMGRFMRNILSHLWFGVQGWLLNAVSQSGVSPPSGWSAREIFRFVLDVMGISVDHVIDLIDRRVPGVGRYLRGAVRVLTGALEWIKIAIEQGPRGLWNHLVNSLGNLGTMVLESAVGWIMSRVVAIVGARIAALAASGGWSGVLEAVKAIYSAIQTAIEYMPRILAVLIRAFDTVTQIASGVIGPAAQMVEGGLRMIMPVVIGFLANYAGLGGIGGRIREIILNIRERVDNAILRLIDGAIAAIRGLYDMLRRGVQAVTDWWRIRKPFRAKDGSPHTLLYVGQGPSARLAFQSDTTELEPFLATLTGTTPTDQTKIQGIRADITLINNLKNTPGNEAAIDAGMARISQKLGDLVESGRWGTEAQPLPLNYPKPRASAYPVLYFGPKTNRTVPQSELADAFPESPLTTKGQPRAKYQKIIDRILVRETREWEGRNYEIKRYFPTVQQGLPGGGRQIGLSAEYTIEVGKKFRLIPGSTEGGRKINNALSNYGYDRALERTDGDHVLEMQLGGPNELYNLWPLDSDINQNSGRTISTMRLPKPDRSEISMLDLKNTARTRPVWLFIARTQ